MRAQLRDAQRDAAKRQAVRRQHQRVGGQGLEGGKRGEEARERDRRPARTGQTATLVLIRGSSMSPAISTPRLAAATSAACSGEWP